MAYPESMEPKEEEVEEIDINDPNFESEGDVGLCADCLTVIPDEIWTKDKFILSGLRGVCPYCKGAVFVMPVEVVEQERRKRREGRLMGG